MLVHVSAAHSRVTVVSMPRDSWVNIPGHGMNKINAAYGLGGPKLMVQTVEQATGLNINDYVEVNFLAFVKVIDALGGVNICLPMAVNDSESGMHMSAGLHHVNGITALKYARDRHSFALSDLTRIQDQHPVALSMAALRLRCAGFHLRRRPVPCIVVLSPKSRICPGPRAASSLVACAPHPSQARVGWCWPQMRQN